MTTDKNVEINSSKEHANTEVAPYKSMITVIAFLAGIWGAVSTATYYIGYSFLQGRILGLGLGSHELKLSTYEVIRQASLAMYQIRGELIQTVREVLELGWGGILSLGVIGAITIKIFLWQKERDSDSKFAIGIKRIPGWLKQLIGLPLLAIVACYILLLCTFSLVSFLWTQLEIAHSVGVRKGKHDISSTVCLKREELVDPLPFAASCTIFFDADKKKYIGKVIFSNAEMTIFLTEEASYYFDKNKKVFLSSMRIKTS